MCCGVATAPLDSAYSTLYTWHLPAYSPSLYMESFYSGSYTNGNSFDGQAVLEAPGSQETPCTQEFIVTPQTLGTICPKMSCLVHAYNSFLGDKA